MKSNAKLEKYLTCGFKNDMSKELVNFTQSSKGVQILKICTLMGFFCPKYIMLHARQKFSEVLCMFILGELCKVLEKNLTDSLKISYINVWISSASKYINLWKITMTCDSFCSTYLVVSSLPDLLYKFRRKKTVDWKSCRRNRAKHYSFRSLFNIT